MNTQRIDLDISKRDALTQMVTIGQGDASGTTIEATIYDNGALLDLTGKTAMLEVRLPDGKSYVRDGDCTVSGGKITYVVDEEHVGAVAGVTDEAYFDILDGPTVIYSTNRFRLRILRSAHDGAQPAESWDNAVDAMIARGDAAIASAISDFDTRQDQNDAAQAENDLMQAKNNADQAINNQAAQGLIAVLLTSDQYDATTRKPTITGEIGKIYLVPRTDGDENDHYIEWMWLNSAWEGVGTTKTAPEAITTDQIDAVIEGEGGTGNQTLSLTGLNYLWAKEVDYFDDHYTGGITTKATQGPAYGPLISVTAEGHAEQDGTPTPSDPKEIVVVRGRNLLPNNVTSQTINGITFTVNADGSITANGTATANADLTIDIIRLQSGASYVLSGCPSGGNNTSTYRLKAYVQLSNSTFLDYIDTGSGVSFNNAVNASIQIRVFTGYTANNLTFYPQIEKGTTAHPYVPYGHVGLDVTADGTTTTTPIPLPSRGWVGSLPDGTHDALSIDGAGNVTWALACETHTYEASDYRETWGDRNVRDVYTNITSQIGKSSDNVLCDKFVAAKAVTNIPYTFWINDGLVTFRFLASTGITTGDAAKAFLDANIPTVLYPLATPTTEDVGYVDLPDIPDGAVVSMPELEGLGVESWTSDAVARYVRAWAARQ